MACLNGSASDQNDFLERMLRFLTGAAEIGTIGRTGAGNGLLVDLGTYPAAVTETWTLTCTAAAANGGTFSVVGSVTGATASATVGVPYDNGRIRFVIRDGTTDFSVGNTITIPLTAGTMILDERATINRYTGISEIKASSFTSAFDPWFTIKTPYQDNPGEWNSAIGQQVNSWVSYRFVRPIDIRFFEITGSATVAKSPTSFRLEYSDDETNWTTLQTFSGLTWTANQLRQFTVTSASPGARRYWRVLVVTIGSGNTAGIQKFSAIESIASVPFNHARPPAAWLTLPGQTGLDPVYVQFQVYYRPAADFYNLAVSGATGFVGSADLDDQPGAYAPMMSAPMRNLPFNFWINATGGHICCGYRIDSIGLFFGVGKLWVYGTPPQYSYPLFLAAPLPAATATRYSDASLTLPLKGNRTNFKLRTMAGTWIQPFTHPYANTTITYRDTNGTHPLIPIIVYDTSNTYGVIPNVEFATGFGNAPENTHPVAGGKVFTVLPDKGLNGFNDYFAVRSQ